MYTHTHAPSLTVAIVGFEMENVTVTEGVDDFAVIRISFLSPPIITSESFTELTIFTQDGNAIGTCIELLTQQCCQSSSII